MKSYSVSLLAAALLVPGVANADDLATSVSRMARIVRATSPTFSPDGKRIAFVSDLNGIPQVWTIPADGGYPQLVTTGDDPVGSVRWSPTGDVLAFLLAPGGGMNTEVYVVRPDGTGLRRLTDGGKDNNGMAGWTHDGRRIMMDSNRRSPAARDPYLVDPQSGDKQLLAEAQGILEVKDVSRDGRRALLSNLKTRGDNNLYLLDMKTAHQTLLTPHEGPGDFAGKLSPDGTIVYLVSNKDRDLTAFSRLKLSANGEPGSIEVVVARPSAELDWFVVNEQGTLAALAWNVGGKHDLSFIELPSGKITQGPELPAELAGGATFSKDGKQLALVLSGAAAPPDIWVMDVASKKLRQVTFSPHAGVDLKQLVRPELVKFKAHDGLELTGWLYRPTEYPELFAAGVNLFGIVNFATFFQHTEPWMAAISTTEYGDPVTQADLLKQLSPIYKLDRVKAALMVQHGANDTNVPVVEAEQIVSNLKSRGVPVEYILFPDEGHGFRKMPNRIRSTVAMVEFFNRYLNREAAKMRN